MDRSSPLYRRYALSKDVLIAMLPIFLMNVITYGLRPLLLLAVSMAFSYLFDALTARMRQEKFDRHDISGDVYKRQMQGCIRSGWRQGPVG